MKKENEASSTDLLCRTIDEHCRCDDKVLFWDCPNGCNGRVVWYLIADEYVSRCMSCGQYSIDVENIYEKIMESEPLGTLVQMQKLPDAPELSSYRNCDRSGRNRHNHPRNSFKKK